MKGYKLGADKVYLMKTVKNRRELEIRENRKTIKLTEKKWIANQHSGNITAYGIISCEMKSMARCIIRRQQKVAKALDKKKAFFRTFSAQAGVNFSNQEIQENFVFPAIISYSEDLKKVPTKWLRFWKKFRLQK